MGAIGVALNGSLGLQGTSCRVLYYVSNNGLPESGECGYREGIRVTTAQEVQYYLMWVMGVSRGIKV